MSLRNTPIMKSSKSIGSTTPSRAIFSATKKSSTILPKPALIKQTSACDLRDRLIRPNDNLLNTGFASTPPLSRTARLSAKSRSTTTINSCFTPSSSSIFRGTSTTSSTSTTPSAASKILPTTPKSLQRRLFGNSATSLNEPFSRTPECFSKVSLEMPTPRSSQRNTETLRLSQKNDDASVDGKTKENNSEISNLTVAVRVRPMNSKECTTPSVINVISVDDKEITVLAGTNADSSAGVSHSFFYDYAFWSCNRHHDNYADQDTVFKGTTMPLIDKAFEGYNACLFAYGQTGSGKSYSMMGIDSGIHEMLFFFFFAKRINCNCFVFFTDDDLTKPNSEAGIIPRFCHELFRRIDELKEKVCAEIEVSYFEIYNEKIHDLLAVTPSLIGGQHSTPGGGQLKRPALRVREHPAWGPYVVDLNTHPVDSHAALKNWLAVGNSQRATAATGMNDKSSRSHSIFSIILNLSEINDENQTENSGRVRKQQTKRSKISLVDLAGSERVSHTCASGERLKEGVSINKSLLTLGKVIAALADAKRHSFVPYRESVLTWLLRVSENTYKMFTQIFI